MTYYKDEYDKLKTKNSRLRNDITKLKEELNNDNKHILHSKNRNDNTDTNINEINRLKSIIPNKEIEINYLKLQLNDNENKKSVNINDIIKIHFFSFDKKIDFPIKCLKTDTFAEVEEKLYQKFDEYRNTNNIFETKGTIILRFKKISENGIQNGDKIQILRLK